MCIKQRKSLKKNCCLNPKLYYKLLLNQQITLKQEFMPTKGQQAQLAIQYIRKCLKILKKQYQSKAIDECYELCKQCSKIFSQYLEQNEQKNPEFYEQLHETTVRMRKDMLKRINNEQKNRQKICKDYQQYISELRNEISDRQAQVKQLQQKIEHIAVLNDYRGQGNTVMLKIESQNRNLRENNKKMQSTISNLQKQIDQLQKKQKQLLNNNIISHRQNNHSNNNENDEDQDLMGDSFSDNQIKEYEQRYEDNLSNNYYVTSIDSNDYIPIHNYSQYKDRKRPLFGSEFKNNTKSKANIDAQPMEEDIWRLLLTQAVSIQGLIINQQAEQSDT